MKAYEITACLRVHKPVSFASPIKLGTRWTILTKFGADSKPLALKFPTVKKKNNMVDTQTDVEAIMAPISIEF
jgi:hypothetical protein